MGANAAVRVIEDREQVSERALEAVFRVFDFWNLTYSEQAVLLGLSEQADLLEWRYNFSGVLDTDVLKRVSHLISIFRALDRLVPERPAICLWLRQPIRNGFFGGKSILGRMLSGSELELALVCDHLEQWVGRVSANDR